MLDVSAVEGDKKQDDADIGDQPLPEQVFEEEDIHAHDEGYHGQNEQDDDGIFRHCWSPVGCGSHRSGPMQDSSCLRRAALRCLPGGVRYACLLRARLGVQADMLFVFGTRVFIPFPPPAPAHDDFLGRDNSGWPVGGGSFYPGGKGTVCSLPTRHRLVFQAVCDYVIGSIAPRTPHVCAGRLCVVFQAVCVIMPLVLFQPGTPPVCAGPGGYFMVVFPGGLLLFFRRRGRRRRG